MYGQPPRWARVALQSARKFHSPQQQTTRPRPTLLDAPTTAPPAVEPPGCWCWPALLVPGRSRPAALASERPREHRGCEACPEWAPLTRPAAVVAEAGVAEIQLCSRVQAQSTFRVRQRESGLEPERRPLLLPTRRPPAAMLQLVPQHDKYLSMTAQEARILMLRTDIGEVGVFSSNDSS